MAQRTTSSLQSKCEKNRLILASASPRRAALLRAAGIRFRTWPAHVREKSDSSPLHATPRRIALHNAHQKAQAAARRFPGRMVLAADTVVALGRSLLGKPRTMREAEAMLQRLSGRAHRVITGVCLCRHNAMPRLFAVTSRVIFKRLTPAQIRDYLKRIHPLDKAGGYAAQEHTDMIIARVEGSFSNVVGLPMERLLRELNRCADQCFSAASIRTSSSFSRTTFNWS